MRLRDRDPLCRLRVSKSARREVLPGLRRRARRTLGHCRNHLIPSSINGSQYPRRAGAAGRLEGDRGRAQDGDGVVRGHQGLDRVDGGPRPGGGARDHRSGTAHHDRGGASLRRLRRAIDRRRYVRAVRGASRARGSSAKGVVCGAAHAGRDLDLRRAAARRRPRADRDSCRHPHWRGRGAIDRDRRAHRVYADRPYDQPRVAPAGNRTDRRDRAERRDGAPGRRIFRAESARPGG